MTHFFYSIISFLTAIFFILLGIIGILIPWSSFVRNEVISLIADHSIAISLFGLTFIAIGVAVVTHILLASRTSYFQFTVGKNHVFIDESVIQHYLSEYWKKQFSGQEIPNRITLKNNTINVTADLPYVEPERQAAMLKTIQDELSELFSDLLGYNQEFHLAVSFQEAPPQSSHLIKDISAS